MNQIMKIILTIFLIGIILAMQVYTSRMKNTKVGLLIPMLLFSCSVMVLCSDLQHARAGESGINGYLTSLSYFSVYNIPTIILLCIYNYYQRNRKKTKGLKR